MSGALDVRQGALLALPDPEAGVVALLERGLAAVEEATTLEDAKHILTQTKVLEAATRAMNLMVETISASGALRVRAERRVGELLASGQKNRGGGYRRSDHRSLGLSGDTPTLADLGISHNESAQYQRLAGTPEPVFERALETATEQAKERHGQPTAGAVLRIIDPEREKRPDEHWLDGDKFIDRVQRLADDGTAMLKLVRFDRYPGAEEALIYDSALAQIDRLVDALAQIRTEIERRKP